MALTLADLIGTSHLVVAFAQADQVDTDAWKTVAQDELDVALEALSPLIGKGPAITQDPDTGVIEIENQACFEPCEMTVRHSSIVGVEEKTVMGWQPQVLRCFPGSRMESDEYDYDDIGDAQSTFHGAVVELAMELAAERVSNHLNAWGEAQALEEEDER